MCTDLGEATNYRGLKAMEPMISTARSKQQLWVKSAVTEPSRELDTDCAVFLLACDDVVESV